MNLYIPDFLVLLACHQRWLR